MGQTGGRTDELTDTRLRALANVVIVMVMCCTDDGFTSGKVK